MKTVGNYTETVYKTCSNCSFNKDGTRDTKSLHCNTCKHFNNFDDKVSRIDIIASNGNDGLHYTPLSEPTTCHYNGWAYGEFAFEHGYDLFQFNIGKYLHRHKKKDGIKDLVKARDYLDKYIELNYGG